MTTVLADKPIVALPPYNDYRATQTGSVIDMAQAAALANRIRELGGRGAYHRDGRSPTAEEQAAFREGRLTGYHKDKPTDRYDSLTFIYVQGSVEQAFEEAGFPVVFDDDRRKVQRFFDVWDDEAKRERRAEARTKFEAGVEAFFAAHPQSPAVERYIRAHAVFGKRGASVPSLAPADWRDRLNAWTNPFGVKDADAPYQPERSGYRLLTNQRVSLGGTQEMYADYSTWIIPVETVEPLNADAARRNLAKIAGKLRTHNGWAGSGSTFDFTLVEEPDGCYVVMGARHSVSD